MTENENFVRKMIRGEKLEMDKNTESDILVGLHLLSERGK